MTMDAYALCDRPMRSVAAWQTAIDELGFGLTLRSDRDLATAFGHLPALWRGREAGFEGSAVPVSELMETYPEIAFGGPWSCAYAFHFATFPAAVGTWFALAACVRLTGGIAFDPQEGLLLTAGQAARYATDLEAEVLALEAR